MKTRMITIFLALSLLLSLCSCFPTKEDNASISSKETITVEQLATQPAHIKEAPFDKFEIDADVRICVKNNFNSYKAKLSSVNIDDLQRVFLKDAPLAANVHDDEINFDMRKIENGSAVSVTSLPVSVIGGYATQRSKDRELTYYLGDGFDTVRLDRNKEFPKGELDFMSSADAIALVDGYMKDLNIPVAGYSAYPITYDYIKGKDDRYVEQYGKDMFYIEHTKEDEYYLIVPRLLMPNGSEQGEISFTMSEVTQLPISSGQVYAKVDKQGLAEFDIGGVYSVLEEQDKAQKIIGVEQAVKIFKQKYSNMILKENVKVGLIELSYLPFPTSENGDFVMKPAWTFYFSNHDDAKSDTSEKRAIDAVTGQEVKIRR